GPDKYISQPHSSDDDNVHSATLGDLATHATLGCVAYREDARQFFYYAALDDFGGCRIDRSGRWLLIEQDVDTVPGRDELIVDLESAAERVVSGQYFVWVSNVGGGRADAFMVKVPAELLAGPHPDQTPRPDSNPEEASRPDAKGHGASSEADSVSVAAARSPQVTTADPSAIVYLEFDEGSGTTA